MSKVDSNDENHADTKQTKSRILRARDIIPGASKSNSEKNSLSANSSGQRPGRSPEDISAEHTDAGQQASGIPKFDLAEEILAEQRKITAIRRKAPSEKVEVPGQEREEHLIDYPLEQPTPQFSEQEQIIAEIVARDIEELCGAGIADIID